MVFLVKLFSRLFIIGDLIYLAISLVKILIYKKRDNTILYYISNLPTSMATIVWLILAMWGTISIINTDSLIILCLAAVFLNFSDGLLKSIFLLSEKTLLTNNKLIGYEDICKIKYRDNYFLGTYLIIIYKKNKLKREISINLSKKSKDIIEKKLENYVKNNKIQNEADDKKT